MRRLALLAAALAFLAGPAAAGLVRIALPERMPADRVIGAEAVVLARPDPGQPFAFAPAVTRKGDAAAAPIPGLFDSQTRRRPGADPETGVPLARDAVDRVRLTDTIPALLARMTVLLDAAETWDAQDNRAAVRPAFYALSGIRWDHLAARATALARIDGPPAIERLRALDLEAPGPLSHWSIN